MTKGLTILRIRGFDSILVRLKAWWKRPSLYEIARFDSILVRLKGEKMNGEQTVKIKFRFHTGSIKSNKERNNEVLFRRCFDSILVRLKEADTDALRVALQAFRFHTGSIKSQAGFYKKPKTQRRFDSILVRLKGWNRQDFRGVYSQVSIPYWFD